LPDGASTPVGRTIQEVGLTIQQIGILHSIKKMAPDAINLTNPDPTNSEMHVPLDR
jgi:hypothetical protein